MGKNGRIPVKKSRNFSPGLPDVPPNWVWRSAVPIEYGIPYSTVRRHEKNVHYLPEIGQYTPKLNVHKIKKYVFYEREQVLELKKLRSYLKK